MGLSYIKSRLAQFEIHPTSGCTRIQYPLPKLGMFKEPTTGSRSPNDHGTKGVKFSISESLRLCKAWRQLLTRTEPILFYAQIVFRNQPERQIGRNSKKSTIFPPNSPESKRVQLILRRILEGVHSGLKIYNEVRVYGVAPKCRKRVSKGKKKAEGKTSQRRELEADYIGLMIIASAGYDPRVDPIFYKSLPEVSYSSTHPSRSRRSEMLNRPEVKGKAVAIYEQVQAGSPTYNINLDIEQSKKKTTKAIAKERQVDQATRWSSLKWTHYGEPLSPRSTRVSNPKE
ncbi:hypothetical protein RJ640_007643 [Escallonia rubra]|uniref:Peptidase M48 domain-containing protein n=1 Tax=Escallonia rubra TaxID=112253 RepID=A0AA88RWR0_9ASTE|nr:hypothetical protein RJ640_007643 [Escallonia rubra]